MTFEVILNFIKNVSIQIIKEYIQVKYQMFYKKIRRFGDFFPTHN